MKKLALFVTSVLVFLLAAAGGSQAAASGAVSPQPYEGAGWETAEEAVQTYLDGFAKADVRQMVSAFAIETYVDHFDFGAQLDRMKVYIPQAEMPYPNANDFFRSMNVEKRQNSIINTIHFQFFSLYFPELDPAMLIPFSGNNAADPQEFLEKLNGVSTAGVKDFAFKGFVDPASLSEQYLKNLNQQNLAKVAGVYGADELKSMAASVSIEGKPLLLCCDAIRYGDRWYLSSLGGNIGALLGIEVYRGGLTPGQEQP